MRPPLVAGPRTLLDMLELEAPQFLDAVTELRHLIVLLDKEKNPNNDIPPSDREFLIKHVNKLNLALSKLGARSALASIRRLNFALDQGAAPISFSRVKDVLNDIELRFSDHLSDIRLFVLSSGESSLFAPADELLATGDQPIEGFARAFPSAAFEVEEAAKCIALSRHTASVFHSMRAIERGLKALSAYLGIPDPTKASERNWGVMLKAISDALDAKWPKSRRLPGTKGAALETLYATIDAVKNPWRNATMHVETIYAPHESIHIARCTGHFLLALMAHCDEEGRPPEDSPAFEGDNEKDSQSVRGL